VNTTSWKQLAADAGGSVADGAWLVRGSGGTQEYYQTFTAVAADRRSERLTMEQTMPSSFGTVSGQWTRGIGASTLLVGAEGKWTDGTVDEIRYSATNVRSGPFVAGGKESLGAVFGRVSFVPSEALTVVVGLRGDFWRSEPEETTAPLPSHSANFVSPRVSASYALSDGASAHGAVYRAHRTPTLNELHRGFRVGNAVTNPNPLLDPETLTGFEGGVLFTRARLSTRLTAFWNELDGAVTNVTISTTPAQITRQRQNTDTVRAAGFELEADFRPGARWTVGGVVGVTRSTFVDAPVQPGLEGNRVPQVPSFQVGGNLTYTDPRGFTGAVQARAFGAQFDDDLNVFELDGYGVLDASATQELLRGLHVFLAIENLFDADYDVGRTPLRTIGWPRTVRMGARVFLP
jgi:outer membrane receptor protein involved in Fe transport